MEYHPKYKVQQVQEKVWTNIDIEAHAKLSANRCWQLLEIIFYLLLLPSSYPKISAIIQGRSSLSPIHSWVIAYQIGVELISCAAGWATNQQNRNNGPEFPSRRGWIFTFSLGTLIPDSPLSSWTLSSSDPLSSHSYSSSFGCAKWKC